MALARYLIHGYLDPYRADQPECGVLVVDSRLSSCKLWCPMVSQSFYCRPHHHSAPCYCISSICNRVVGTVDPFQALCASSTNSSFERPLTSQKQFSQPSQRPLPTKTSCKLHQGKTCAASYAACLMSALILLQLNPELHSYQPHNLSVYGSELRVVIMAWDLYFILGNLDPWIP